MQVRNQSYLRRKNKNSIIELLRKKTQSYSDLARELKLSNTAIANIVDDLISENVVYRESDSKGRGGINLSINADYGYVVAVDLSRWQIILSAADFGSNILTTATIDDITFKKGDIEKIVAAVEALTKREELKGRALRCIAVASPGKIDKKSGKFILNPRFREIGNISLQAVFEEAFGCKVVIKNDINLALLGEKMYGGVLKNVQNALMLHVDVGMGAALLIDGKVYEGSHGFAGEIGYFKLNMLLSDENNYGNLNYGNYYDSTSLFSVLSIVKREISPRHGDGAQRLAGSVRTFLGRCDDRRTFEGVSLKGRFSRAGDTLSCTRHRHFRLLHVRLFGLGHRYPHRLGDGARKGIFEIYIQVCKKLSRSIFGTRF